MSIISNYVFLRLATARSVRALKRCFECRVYFVILLPGFDFVCYSEPWLCVLYLSRFASAERTRQIIQSGFLDLEFGPPIYILIKGHIVVEM